MKFNKNDLLRTLLKVKPGIAKKAIVEEFTHFIITGKQVTTYNDDICICHPLETDFKCSAKAEDLYKILSGIKEDLIDITLKDDKLSITTSKTRAKLATTSQGDAEEYIELLKLDSLKWVPLPADFVKGLFLCMFSASSDMTKGILTCVHIDGKKVNSSDEVRISEYTMETAIDKEVLIPARNVVELVSFDIKDYCINENWAHFKTSEGVIFSSRIMAGDYEKDFSPFLDVDAEAFELPEGFKDIIESITFMTEGDVNIDKVVNLQIKDKKIICRAEKEIGWIEKEVEFNFDHNVTIQINPNFLSQVLEKATKLKAGEDRALFESGNFKHVIALPED